MQSLNAISADAIKRLKTAVDVIDAKILGIQAPLSVSKSSSPGSILAVMSLQPRRPTARDALKALTDVKTKLTSQYFKSLDQINTIGKHLDQFQKAADHVDTGAVMTDVDPVIYMLATTARKGVLTGTVPHTMASELRNLVMQGYVKLDEKRSALNKIYSAGRIAHRSKSATAFGVLSEHPGYNKIDKTILAAAAKAASNASADRKAQHRANYY